MMVNDLSMKLEKRERRTMITSTITSIFNTKTEVITGNEDFPIYGDLITKDQLEKMLFICAEYHLNSRWNCIDKAIIARTILGQGIIVIGTCLIYSSDMETNYGFEFQKSGPYEIHAWLSYKDGIVDIALPGVIQSGLELSDEHGPFLSGRSPVVLAGKPADWMFYKSERYLPIL
jgi:hypothetical protein